VQLAEDALDVDLKGQWAMAKGHEAEGEHEHGPGCAHGHDHANGNGQDGAANEAAGADGADGADEADDEDQDALRTIDEIIQDFLAQSGRSGAEVESILIRSKRRAYIQGRGDVTRDDLVAEAGNYIPNLPLEQLELQMLAAIIECSDRRFLPRRLARLDREEVITRFRELCRQERMGG